MFHGAALFRQIRTSARVGNGVRCDNHAPILPAAPLRLAARTTGTWVISTNDRVRDCFLPTSPVHHRGWWPLLRKQLAHNLHRLIDMLKEHFVASAEVIQPKFTTGCSCKPVLWAFAMAGKPDITFDALRW